MGVLVVESRLYKSNVYSWAYLERGEVKAALPPLGWQNFLKKSLKKKLCFLEENKICAPL